MRKPGHPTIFNEEEEKSFVAQILTLSEHCFPVTEEELILTVKSYLVGQGRTVTKFRNNLPGKDWVKRFISRHKELRETFANNIKRSPAA